MRWTHSIVRRNVCMVRIWNRIINLDPQCLPRKVLEWDIYCNGNIWSSNLKSILSSMDRAFNTRNIVCTRAAWSSLHEIYCNQWQQDELDKPKLRTYVNFKVSYNVENYVMSFMSHAQRSYLAQLRCGVLPLHIETGRWQGTQLDKRICKVCNGNSVENKEHFIFHCNKYNNNRLYFYQQICNPAF